MPISEAKVKFSEARILWSTKTVEHSIVQRISWGNQLVGIDLPASIQSLYCQHAPDQRPEAR